MPARTGGHGSGLLRPAQGPRARLLLDDGTVEHYEGLEPPSWRHFGRTRFLGKNFFGYDTGCFCFLGLYLLLVSTNSCLLPLYFDPGYLVLPGSPKRPLRVRLLKPRLGAPCFALTAVRLIVPCLLIYDQRWYADATGVGPYMK